MVFCKPRIPFPSAPVKLMKPFIFQPQTVLPTPPSLPSSPQGLAETQESRRQRAGPSVSTRVGDTEGLWYSPCPVKTTRVGR